MSKQDILFKTEKHVFSYRVAGLLMQNDKILLQRPNNDTGYAFPGGHVSFGETHEETLIREFKEEMGVNIKVGSLKWVGELFFPWGNKDCQQICLFYLISLADETEIPLSGSFWGTEQLENQTFKLEFSWMPLSDILKTELYPIESKQLLTKYSDTVEHFISIEQDFTIQMATNDDLELWMKLVKFIRTNFPGLETEEQLQGYQKTVEKNIGRRTAICAKQNDIVVGILLFSYNQNCLSCMAVHPAYRKRGIASAMINKMLSLLPDDKDIWVSTFRENDEKGIAPRALYKKFGFVLNELFFDENNYPHQKFILHRK
ncbi:GNAT family N-acetyltransferase [Paenibacillus profundus]|uniref:GNAT family N-acetyltransferase n=1 Tax=Paenibacillus profundus TaxID=1173085 RepID=A0ABS8YBW6_9BACL|nr:GNAT family N-acetyltransferase [Paenibacillus profundus]MCE5168364.1 GNAT family N-acetyltransferase [Paenibacillus profundus]